MTVPTGRTIDNNTNAGPLTVTPTGPTAGGPRGVTAAPIDNANDVGAPWQPDQLSEKVVVEGEEAGSVPDGSITTAKLAAGAVTKAKAACFISTEQTGTGSSQDIAHGLGVVPVAVFVAPTDLAPVTTGDYTVTEGAHDITNVKVTVTTGKKFKIWAWA